MKKQRTFMKKPAAKTGGCFFAVLFLLFFVINGSIYAQEFGFGFGDDEDGDTGAGNSMGGALGGGGLSVTVGGEVSASMLGYVDDFSGGLDNIELGDIFSGQLTFSAKTSNADGVINLNVEPSESPISIDEAYLRGFFGSFEIAAGLRKLTWGKADSMGPLDVINPLDTAQIYTAMADSNSLMSVKIARPLVHASFRFGQFSKIEGVFVPWFEPHTIATEGRWMPAQMKMFDDIPEEIPTNILSPLLPPGLLPVEVNVTDELTPTLNYAQAGLRFTTTIGPADIGVQYYYGRMPQPSVKITGAPNYGDPPAPPIPVGLDVNISYLYNPYHQFGLDYAQVLFGFNVRAELAANITEDLAGDDGTVYNPSIAWSLGFDRDLFLGINLNLQVNESIRLFHDKLGSSDMMSVMTGDFDIEGGSELTSTRLTARLSKKFLRDELELRAAVVWGIEDKDFLIMPALIWTKDDISFALSGGIFAGDEEGQLGQYKNNNFIKASLTYSF